MAGSAPIRWPRLGLLAACAALAACATPDPGPVPGRMIQADGAAIHVRDWGADAAPDIFLIHGAASHMGEFEASLVPELSGDFHLLAYDRPGMGRSPGRPADAETLAAQARIAAAVISAEGLERPVVVGHSYGGAVALRLALDHPDLVAGLVLLGPVSHPWSTGVAWHYHVSANPLIGPAFNRTVVQAFAGRAARSALDSAFAPRPVPDAYFDAARVELALRPRALRANAEDMVALNGELGAQAPRYGDIAMPVAILAGADDDVLSTAIHAGALDRDIANTNLTVLDGVGHMPQHARPDLVAGMIAWVRESAAPPAP